MKIHHIGIACKDIYNAKEHYDQLGFHVVQDFITDDERNLDYIFMENNGVLIELVSKHNTEKKSDIDSIVSQLKPIGNKMYHICFSTNNMKKGIDQYIKKGYKLIKAPARAVACNNKNVAFLIHIDFGLIELIEESE